MEFHTEQLWMNKWIRRLWNSNSSSSLLPPGINIFLDGYVPTENLRFRETSLVFKVAETANEEEVKRLRHYQVCPARLVLSFSLFFAHLFLLFLVSTFTSYFLPCFGSLPISLLSFSFSASLSSVPLSSSSSSYVEFKRSENPRPRKWLLLSCGLKVWLLNGEVRISVQHVGWGWACRWNRCLICCLFVLFFVQYPEMAKTMGEFTLEIKGGEFTDSEIMVMLGENGTLRFCWCLWARSWVNAQLTVF